MPEPSETAPEAVDVAAIMVEIREGIERRRRQGFRTPDEIERLLDERLRAYGERADIDPRLLKQILHPSHDWNIAVDYRMRTERPGIVGAAILMAKRVVRPFVRLYTDHVLKRQSQVNLYLMYFLQDATRQIVRLELEVADLKRRLEEHARTEGRA
jgi:hypothetical protein